ncbi:MAG: AraC family transcriptional regulator ligand-binding domain-containing protein [Pseudomonadota bacterium]
MISLQFVTALCDSIDGHQAEVRQGRRLFALDVDGTGARRVPLKRYVDFFEWLAERIGRPDLALELASEAGPETIGAVGYMFAGARNLRAAFQNLGYFLHAFQDDSELYAGVDGDYAYLHYQILDTRIHRRRQDTEYTLAYNWHIMRAFYSNSFALTMVEFEHERPPGGDKFHRRLFGAPVLFQRAVNRLHFRADYLDTPSRAADPKLAPVLRQQMQEFDAREPVIASFTDQVRAQIKSINSRRGPLRAGAVAKQLGVSEATLYRRLKREGTRFKQLTDIEAKAQAEYLIAQDYLPIGVIARRLGFAETASLTRAFYRWFGKSPREVRKSMTDGAS